MKLNLPWKRLTPEEWLGLGDGHLRNAEIDQAFRCYQQAVSRRPDFGEAWRHSGVLLGIAGQYLSAIRALEEAIKIEARDTTSWRLKGFLLFRLNRFEEALACFDRTIALDGGDFHAWYWRGLALQALGREEERIEAAFGEAERRSR
ncbi:MAG: tetratricopeptide repeat protein, partial [Methanosarcinales archaeon]|nr:tetratricopeptide repeat protein [Methanosarcinales archaeon]